MEKVNWKAISDKDAAEVLQQQRVDLIYNLRWKEVTGILYGNGKITPHDKNEIEGKKTQHDASYCLLDIVTRKGNEVFKDFVEALSVTSQPKLFNDVIQCLEGNKPQIIEEEMWAGVSDEDAFRVLQKHHVELTTNLSWKEVAHNLFQDGILRPFDYDDVESKKTDYDSRDCLLDIVRKKGKEAFKKFMKALTLTKQNALFNELKTSIEAILRKKQSGTEGQTIKREREKELSDRVRQSEVAEPKENFEMYS